MKTTKVPDETLFATVNFNPQLKVPGTYNGETLKDGPGVFTAKEVSTTSRRRKTAP